MEYFELIKSRRSIRIFKDEPVPGEIVTKILDAARLAPSAGNLQPYEFRIVEDVNIMKELTQAAYGQGFIHRAPVVLVFIENCARSKAKYGMRGTNLYTRQDTAIAVTYAQLAAHDLGLGSCWVGAFDSPAVARILDLGPGLVPVSILPIGYPGENPEPAPRRSLNDLLSSNK